MALLADQYGDRTEMPTPLRLAEARRAGRVPRSGDLVCTAVLAGGATGLALCGGRLFESLKDMTGQMLTEAGKSVTASGAMGLSWTPVRAVALYAILLAGVFVVVAALANIAQFGWLVTSEPIKPRIARISPAMGLRRFFSSRSIVRAVLSVAKIAGVSVVFVALLGKTAETARDLATQKLTVAASGLAGLAWGLSVRLLALLALLGLVDLLYQRRQYRNDLKITRRQLLEDLRRMEGNPRRAGRRHMQAEKLGRNAKQQEANED